MGVKNFHEKNFGFESNGNFTANFVKFISTKK